MAGIATALGFLGAAVAIIQNGRTSRAANYFALTRYLQDTETRSARKLILKRATADAEARATEVGGAEHATQTRPQWRGVGTFDEIDEDAASVVASSYDIAARAVQMKYVHKDPFLDDYGPSVLRCWEYLEPFVVERRQLMRRPRYWDNFERLAMEVQHWEKRNP